MMDFVTFEFKQSTKKWTVIAIAITLLFTVGCTKTNNYRWVFYDETYCADAWKPSNNNETLKQNVVDYFEGAGVTIFDIEIFSDMDIEPYSTCTNHTGRRIKCKVKKNDLEKIKSYGFYQ